MVVVKARARAVATLLFLCLLSTSAFVHVHVHVLALVHRGVHDASVSASVSLVSPPSFAIASHDHNRDRDRDYSVIRKGEIYVQHNFLNASQVALLREDIAQLQNQHDDKPSTELLPAAPFQPSGLSNRVANDRNIFGSSDRLTCTITPDLFRGEEQFSGMRRVVEQKMEDLKLELQAALSPPTSRCTPSSSNLELELAELYYSISPKGSHLPRHQDERHEETKGSKGWINDTRRSISWLIYLNDSGWEGSSTSTSTNNSTSTAGQGGELRGYIRKCIPNERVQCGSHDGNIQVGWLRIESSSSSSSSLYEPIFLDSWVKTRSLESNHQEYHDHDSDSDSLEWQAMSALYRIRTGEHASQQQASEQASEQASQQQASPEKPLREYLSPPFGPNSPSWPSEQNLEPTDFSRALALQLHREDHRRQFVGVEDIASSPSSEIVDVVPTGGTLVLFDSVTVPHEVLEVTQGNRLAIAGWYHEKQQEFPEWYGT